MSSSYRGLYVQCSNGQIHSVQVADPGGISIPLTPEIYLEKEIMPPMESLPDAEQYRKRQE